jgi:hypothetical protein
MLSIVVEREGNAGDAPPGDAPREGKQACFFIDAFTHFYTTSHQTHKT